MIWLAVRCREDDRRDQDQRQHDQAARSPRRLNALVARPLTHGPSTALSLHSMQQEDGRARQQHPGQHLDALGEQAERRAGDQHDRGRARDQRRRT